MKLISCLIPIMFLFLGCSAKKFTKVDEQKSIYALQYEQKKINDFLHKNRLYKAKAKDMDYYNKLGGLTLMSSVSLIPDLILSSYFYVMPSLTIYFYNRTMNYDDQFKKIENSKKRAKDLITLLKIKNDLKESNARD